MAGAIPDAPIGDIYRSMRDQYQAKQGLFEEQNPGLNLIKDLDTIARVRVSSHNRAIADYAFYRRLGGGNASAGMSKAAQALHMHHTQLLKVLPDLWKARAK